MPGRLTAYLCLTAAMITVGSTVLASKIVGASLPPFTATALRFALALPVFAVLMWLTGTRWPRPGRRDAVLLVLQGLAGSVGYTVCLIAGTPLTTAGQAGVIVGALPAVAALTSAVVLRERPTPRLLAAIAIATLGVVIVAASGGHDEATRPRALLGNLLVLAAVVCEAFFILLNKRLRVPLPALSQATTMAAVGLLACALPAVWEWQRVPFALAPQALAGVAYYAMVPTVAGFWLWYAGAARVASAEASLFTAVAPIAAVVMAAAWPGETVGPAVWFGLAAVIVTVALAATGGVGSRVEPVGGARRRA